MHASLNVTDMAMIRDLRVDVTFGHMVRVVAACIEVFGL